MDERTLLAQVLQAPDREEPRLRYADAIRLRDPQRAELIRAQCALWRMGSDPHAPCWDGPRREELLQRCDALLSVRARDWAAELLPFTHDRAFRRGFVEWVSMDARAFLEQGDRLFALAPVQHADLSAPEGALRELLASPGLRRLRSLSLRGANLGDEGARLIAASDAVEALAWLDLGEAGLGLAGVEALARSPHLRGARWVDLSGNAGDVREQPLRDFDGSIATVDAPAELHALEERVGRVAWLHVPEDAYAFGRWPPPRFELRQG